MKKKDSELIDLFERTINNCGFYMRKKDFLHFMTEIHCLRGIYYCLESRGLLDYINGIDKELFNSYIGYSNCAFDVFESYNNLITFYSVDFDAFSSILNESN